VIIYRADVEHIAHTGMRAGHHLDQHGEDVWRITKDWESPLRAAALVPGRGAGPSDPTGGAATNEDELRHAHQSLVDAIAAYETASEALYGLLERYRPMTSAERRKAGERANKVRYCAVCDEPALPRPRSRMCVRCYNRYAHLTGSITDLRRLHQRREAAEAG
jgi:hypothetical protein